MSADKIDINWELVEKDYRAGVRPLRDIAKDNGITEGAIRKRAKRDEWTRNLTSRIKAKAEEKVRKAEVRKASTQEAQMSTATEKQVVEVNSEVLAQADLLNRKDVLLALDVSRSQLQEVALLCDPLFKDNLAQLGELMDKSSEDENGKVKADKMNELYSYIVGLAGRVKLSKDIAASFGVYIPMQRKILKLEDDSNKNQTELDTLLAKINATVD